jgi:hypothetical protein
MGRERKTGSRFSAANNRAPIRTRGRGFESLSLHQHLAKIAVRKARPLVVAAAARHAAKARWANATPQQRKAHVAMMKTARRLARKNKAA